MENNWINLIKLLEKILILTKIVCHLKNKKKEGRKEDLLNLRIEKNK